MRNLIIEIQTKDGVRIERISLGEHKVSIGRAWNSDVVVQDRFVDADHLGLDLNSEQQVLVTDFETINGSRLAGKVLSDVATPYRFGEILQIGDTRLRVFDAESSVDPTSLRSRWFLMAESFSSMGAIFSLTAVALILDAIRSYTRSITPIEFGDLVVSGFGVLISILIWSLVLGFISKLLRGESNVKPHWILACIAMIGYYLIDTALLVVRFNLQNIDIGELLTLAAYGVLTTCLLVGVFSYTSYMQTGRKWLCAMLVVISFYGVIHSDELLKEPHQQWSSTSRTEVATLPPRFLLRDSVSLDEYQLTTDKLFVFDQD